MQSSKLLNTITEAKILIGLFRSCALSSEDPTPFLDRTMAWLAEANESIDQLKADSTGDPIAEIAAIMRLSYQREKQRAAQLGAPDGERTIQGDRIFAWFETYAPEYLTYLQ